MTPALAAARARGRTGGRKPKLNDRQAATVRRMYAATGPDGKRQHTVAVLSNRAEGQRRRDSDRERQRRELAQRYLFQPVIRV